jgi:hypothetical protein
MQTLTLELIAISDGRTMTSQAFGAEIAAQIAQAFVAAVTSRKAEPEAAVCTRCYLVAD